MRKGIVAVFAALGIVAGVSPVSAWGARFYRPSAFGWQDPFDSFSVFDNHWPSDYASPWHRSLDDFFEDDLSQFLFWTPRFRDAWEPREIYRDERCCQQRRRENANRETRGLEEHTQRPYNGNCRPGHDKNTRMEKLKLEQKRLEEEKRQQNHRQELKLQREEAARIKHEKELQRLQEEGQAAKIRREKELQRLREVELRRLQNEKLHYQQEQERVLRARRQQELDQRERNNQNIVHEGKLPRNVNKKESQLYALYIEGYDPDDIAIETKDGTVYIHGHHKCSCEENCFERSFYKFFTLPYNVDSTSLTATLDKDHILKVKGFSSNQIFDPVDTHIKVSGVDIPQSSSTPCVQKRTGFKKQVRIDKRTGQAYEPEPYELDTSFDTQNHHDFENDDDSTIEVEEYY